MHKARKEITAILPKVDFLIELVDARIPYSSGNPLIAELRDQKPLLKLLNKRSFIPIMPCVVNNIFHL